MGIYKDNGKEHESCHLGFRVTLGGTPHPVIANIRDTRDYVRVLLYFSYTTFAGWGVLLKYSV